MRRSFSLRSLGIAWFMCAALAVVVQAAEPEKQGGGRRVITARTAYLHELMEGAHQITLRAHLEEGTGELMLDPNTCALNDFGDPTVCTKIAPKVLKVELSQLRLADPSGQGRKIFAVEAKELANQLFLVVPTKRGSAFRLVGRDRDSVYRVVTLEPRSVGKGPRRGDKPSDSE